MLDINGWNWEPGKRVVLDTSQCCKGAEWLEEWQASPDGEKFGCVANVGEAEFALCINGELTENTFEKAIIPRFSPDGKLAAIVCQDMEWTVAVDGEAWETSYGFVWDMRFVDDKIAVAVQQDMQYGMSTDGEAWETMFENANNFAISADGTRTAAAVQVKSLGQADIATFQEGIFSLAVDGNAWENVFMNVWTPTFSADNNSVACQVRRTLYDYTIAVDDKPWAKNFSCVWEPCFNPATGSVIAPVRMKGRWGLAQDGELLWNNKYYQLWQQKISEDGKTIAAICAPDFGKFTIVKNEVLWDITFNTIVDLAITKDGQRAACLGRDANSKYHVVVDGSAWSGNYDMAWKPVFSENGANCAARVEKNGKFAIMVNGTTYGQTFDQAFDPIFSPCGTKVLIKGLVDGKFTRIVANVNDF